MFEARINDPSSVSREAIVESLARNERPILQFSRPGYTAALLKQLNKLCAEFGDRIDVRFYAHYPNPGAFDAAVLDDLPDVRSLTVDCLTSIVNEDAVCRLALTRLSFGVYRFDRPDFLERLGIGALSHLTLSETAKRNFDLAPLEVASRLERLFLQGHTKNIESIASLPKLRDLALAALPKTRELSFLNSLAPLRSLELLLGGRASIDEIEHRDLEALSIHRVRGFTALGSIARFPQLQTLDIQDQLKLHAIDVAGAQLRTLMLGNCKRLERIDGLASLDRLVELLVRATKLDLDALLERDWPDSMEVVALYSGSKVWDQKARARLVARGFRDRVSRR